VAELKDGMIRTYDITPDQLLGRTAKPEDLAGGDPTENAAITRHILSGEKGPRRDVVLVNAGAALVAAGVANDFADGIQQAAVAIDEGAAAAKLDALVRFTQANG
jgi:anthranilate phosphoribosyltransferase